MADDIWLWVRLKLSTLSAARAALRILGIQLHDEARVEPGAKRREDLRAEGDHYIAEEREIQIAETRAQFKTTDPTNDP